MRLYFLLAAAALGCVYEGREPGVQVDFGVTDANAKTTPIAGWSSGRADGGVTETGTDAGSDVAIDGSDAASFPTPEQVVTGEGYHVAVRGDAFAAYVSVLVGGSLDTQLQLRDPTSRVLQNGTQILSRNRILLDDTAVAASNANGVFLYPRTPGARVDIAFGFMPQGVQLAGLGPTHVYYLRTSQVPGGFDELRRRARSSATDEIVACSKGTSAFDVVSDGFAVVGRVNGTFAITLAPLAGACAAETNGTQLSPAANPVSLVVGSTRVIIGVDGGVSTVLSAVPRSGGASESIGAAALGLWGSDPGRPLAELSDTLFFVEETGTENFVVERPAGGPTKRLATVARRSVRAMSANATHVYFSTPQGIFRVPR